jgi:heat-inducible transcriptional repressor
MTSKPEQARNIVSAVEDGEVFVTLTNGSPADGIPVAVIGQENLYESLQEFSVITARYGRPGGSQGIVGIIAPTRMDYSRAIPAVRHTAWNLSQMTSVVFGD